MSDVARAYDDAANSWASGSALVYAALASAVAAAAPDLHGSRVIDIGAGTGVLAEALLARGAREVVAVDLAPRMLAKADAAVTCVVADATSLPFGDGCFDLAATAFCLSHLPDPLAGLREARRTAGQLLSASFDETWTHPAKAAADEVLAGFGYRPPEWYLVAKRAASVDNHGVLLELAKAAGYASYGVQRLEVDTGLVDPVQLADWRLGMAQVAPFVTSLDRDARQRVRRAVEAALDGLPRLVVPVLVLTAR